MDKEPKNIGKLQIPKSVPLSSDWFDKWGVSPDTDYTVEVINKNEDMPGKMPDFGVIITKPDSSRVAHIIETHQIRVKPGDVVKFYREEHRR